MPDEGRPYVRFDVSVLKNAPHPNAARLFINHFLELESQLVFANAGFDPTMQGVIEKSETSIRALLKTKVMGTTVVERQNQMLELAKRIYKRPRASRCTRSAAGSARRPRSTRCR